MAQRVACSLVRNSRMGRRSGIGETHSNVVVIPNRGEHMNNIGKFILTCAVLVALAAPAFAHHSAAAFNTQQEVKITGTITEYKFRNPHIYMTVQVKKPDGSSTLVEIEAGAAS